MANRIRFIQLNRAVHFYASIVIVVFSLVYVITGFVLSKSNWFTHGREVITERTYNSEDTVDESNIKTFEHLLRQRYRLSGKMEFEKIEENSFRFAFYKPGKEQVAIVNNATNSIQITSIEKHSIFDISNGLHRIHSFQGGLLYFIWGIFVDLTATAFIVFALTGIILWFKMRKSFRLGWIFLLLPLLVAMILILNTR